ncbi:MAG: hypothetical protein OEW75_19545, partial [Cyclobacteriaceae bacterium]|nr:hypothetical protein [Cyclobacteriaceae bacterium]
YSENGFDYFDFGPSVGLDNVEKFKSGFGTTPHLHHIYEYKSNLYKHILRPLQMLKSRLL